MLNKSLEQKFRVGIYLFISKKPLYYRLCAIKVKVKISNTITAYKSTKIQKLIKLVKLKF